MHQERRVSRYGGTEEQPRGRLLGNAAAHFAVVFFKALAQVVEQSARCSSDLSVISR